MKITILLLNLTPSFLESVNDTVHVPGEYGKWTVLKSTIFSYGIFYLNMLY